jgi:CheY-like chemotaxis protein
MISVNILSKDALHQKKILIVDDESNLRLLLIRTLSTKGYVTKEAADGFEAGIQVLEFKPDLVLLDLKMPGMDGFEVCRKIKGNPKTANTLVVALTGHGGDENRNRIFKAGADGFLGKPVVRDQLLNMLEALLVG